MEKRVLNNPFGALFLLSIAAALLFWYCFPTHFLIADELAYFEQANAWAKGLNHLPRYTPCGSPLLPAQPSDYPAGTSLLAAIYIFFGGAKAVFWSSFSTWMLGTWALAYALYRSAKPVLWALYPWLFLPALVLMRTVMSDVPSFMLAAFFVLFSTSYSKNRLAYFGSGIIGGLGLLFRETNLLWFLPISIGLSLRKKPFHQWLWIGFFIGLLPRLASGWLLYQDPFFMRASGIEFSWTAMPENLAFYCLALLVLLPGGLWFWWKSTHPYRTEFGVCIVLFVLLYSAYGYNAFAKSGYKGLVLLGRYLLPLLPFFALCVAFSSFRFSKKLSIVFLIAVGFLFYMVQAVGKVYNTEQQRLTDILSAFPISRQISFTADESAKFWNSLYGASTIPDESTLSRKALHCGDIWYPHIILRGESQDRIEKAKSAHEALGEYFENWDLKLQHDLTLMDGTTLHLWRAKRVKQND